MPTIVSGTIQLTYLCLTKQSKQPNKPHRIRRRLRKKFRRTKKYRRRPKPKHSHHVVLASHKIKRKTDEPEQPPVSYDTDGIPFIIDNLAICILCNVRSLFIGKLKAEPTITKSADGQVCKQHYIGTCRLKFSDNANVTRSYDIPGCIYDPDTSFNIIGIPVLEEYFGDKASGPQSNFEDNGAMILSSGGRSLFKWDHGKHT